MKILEIDKPMIDSLSTHTIQASLADLPDHLQALQAKRWVVISDSNLENCLDWSWNNQPRLIIPAGESSKNLSTVQEIYHQLAQLQIDRQTWIIALGGGVVGDLAGFVAATYLRGLPLVQVPTSLMAQVDSSLGGKVGVDLSQGKNLVGSFYPARLIYLDTDLLKTLPAHEWQSGMAEVLKHALLDGEKHWQFLEQLPTNLNPEQKCQLVLHSRLVKEQIISQDPLEHGIRAHLNLGHTLAHAIESAQGYAGLNHGQAVGLGLRAALRLSQWQLNLDPQWEARLLTQLQRYHLPTQAPILEFSQLLPFLKRDKKNYAGQLRCVLIEEPGRAQICSDLTLAQFQRCWEELK